MYGDILGMPKEAKVIFALIIVFMFVGVFLALKSASSPKPHSHYYNRIITQIAPGKCVAVDVQRYGPNHGDQTVLGEVECP